MPACADARAAEVRAAAQAGRQAEQRAAAAVDRDDVEQSVAGVGRGNPQAGPEERHVDDEELADADEPHAPSSDNAIVNGSKRATAPRPARMPARKSAEFVAV